MAAPMTLREHREAAGLSMRALAAKVEPMNGTRLSTQTIVSIEQGKPARISTYHRLAKALGIAPLEIREFRDLVVGRGTTPEPEANDE